jgi:hypothetical protein
MEVNVHEKGIAGGRREVKSESRENSCGYSTAASGFSEEQNKKKRGWHSRF